MSDPINEGVVVGHSVDGVACEQPKALVHHYRCTRVYRCTRDVWIMKGAMPSVTGAV